MEEGAHGHDIARLGPGRQGPSKATLEGRLALDLLPDAHALHLRDVGRTEVAGPVRGFPHGGMPMRQPPADLTQESAEGLAHFGRQGRRYRPAFDPGEPDRIDALDLRRVSSGGADRRLDKTQRRDGTMDAIEGGALLGTG